jgi:3-hydroxyisobutyrate dehydrogenase
MAAIGFIGLGHMGAPMVRNLLKHGHDVTVFDISQEAMQALTEHGAKPANSLLELAKNKEFVFSSLQTGDQVKYVCDGSDGLFATLSTDAVFVDCSSIDIESARELHRLAQSKGLHLLDAPVSGGVAGAEAATLTIMVGGDAATFNKALPLLQLLGKNIIHAGAAGNGQAAKICNNMLLGISMIGVCEAMTLSDKLGLDPKVFFEIAAKSSGQCWSLTSYCPVPGPVPTAPSNRDYAPGFTAQMMLKDLHLSQDAASTVDINTPLGYLATQLYQRFVEEGFGQKDFSGIIKMLATDVK